MYLRSIIILLYLQLHLSTACDHLEYYPDESDCQNYFLCVNNIKYPDRCADGLYFDLEHKPCNFDYLVDCAGRPTRAPITDSTTTIATTSTIPTTTDMPTTTEDPECKHGNHYEDPLDCSKFYICSHGELVGQDCAPGNYFDTEASTCVGMEDVDCGERPIPTPSVETTTELTESTTPPTTTTSPSTTEAYGFCSLHPCGIYPHSFYANRFVICPNDFSSDELSYACSEGLLYFSQARTCLPDAFCSMRDCGIYADPSSVSQFYLCLNDYSHFNYTCAAGAIFNSTLSACEFI